jgi:hypothetical protein
MVAGCNQDLGCLVGRIAICGNCYGIGIVRCRRVRGSGISCKRQRLIEGRQCKNRLWRTERDISTVNCSLVCLWVFGSRVALRWTGRRRRDLLELRPSWS